MSKYFSLIIFIIFVCCKTNKTSSSKLETDNEKINLYVFIGEKISIVEFNPNEPKSYRIEIDSISGDTIQVVSYIMDQGFICKYKVIENIFNDLKTDTITFKTFDHYGRPGFENYENALLYISISTDSTHYYHQKYLFDPLKKNTNRIFSGLNGETIEELFLKKKKGVFTKRGLFD